MRTSVKYSPKSTLAIAYLKQYANDIDIFVEDTSNPNMWLRYLRKLLPDDIRLDSVTPLAGRASVVEACRANQLIRNRPKLFIIDGDYDLLTKKSKPRLKNLYRLRRYCLENYLLQEEALILAITTVNTRMSEAEARSKLALEEWLRSNKIQLRQLFVCYATCCIVDSSVKTIGLGAMSLTKDKHRTTFCLSKTRRRTIAMYRSLIKTHGREIVRRAYERVVAREEELSVIDYVSAKDYIFPLVQSRLKHSCSFNLKTEQMCTLIASHMSTDVDPYLKRTLRTIIGGRSAQKGI